MHKKEAKTGNSTLIIVFPKSKKNFNESLKNYHFWVFLYVWPFKGHFRQKNRPLSSQTATYWKTEDIQSYLRIWGTKDSLAIFGTPKMAKFGSF